MKSWCRIGPCVILLFLGVCGIIYVYGTVTQIIFGRPGPALLKNGLWLLDAMLLAYFIVARKDINSSWLVGMCWTRIVFVVTIDLWLNALRCGNWNSGWSICNFGTFGEDIAFGGALMSLFSGIFLAINTQEKVPHSPIWHTATCVAVSALWVVIAFLVWRPVMF